MVSFFNNKKRFALVIVLAMMMALLLALPMAPAGWATLDITAPVIGENQINKVEAGTNVTFVATVPDAKGVIYAFWVGGPNGRSLEQKSASNEYTLKNVQPGTYTVDVYISNMADQVLAEARQVILVDSSVEFTKISYKDGNVTLTAQAKYICGDPEYQFWYKDSEGWKCPGDFDYNTRNTVSFEATAGQTYEVVVYAKDQNAARHWKQAAVACGSIAALEDNPKEPTAFIPGEPLDQNEMRITFMGTSVVPRRGQQCNSVFVETGNGDSFIFDMGSGVSANYVAMGIPYSRMDKVFLTHLHGDHMSDLTTLYCFGPSLDRKTPLRLFGPSGDTADDGTMAFAEALKQLTKWHVESFCFTSTGLKNGKSGYDIEVKELPYMEVGGIAYNENGVKITHFPAVHDRDGSISYKLEWNGLSMVFSGDTKPNYFMTNQAKGVDVLVHEMVVPPEVWAAKNSGLKPEDPGWQQAINYTTAVQDSSHTTQKAFGYILSQTNPRLGVATHFQVNDDTVGPAMKDIRTWCQGPVTLAKDLLVINVSKDNIRQRYAEVSDYAWYPAPKLYPPDQLAPPKYPSPLDQLNNELLEQVIPASAYE